MHKVLLFLFALLLPLGALRGADQAVNPLQQAAYDIQHPSLGTPRAVSKWNVQLGKGSLSLQEGQLLPLLAGGVEIGFYFRGNGSFSLSLDQPDELPVLRFNLARNTKAKLVSEAGVTRLDLPVTELALFYAGIQASPMDRPEAMGPAAQTQEAWRAFQQKHLLPGWANRSHIILASRRNQPAQAAWYLDLVGPLGQWEFVRDPWMTRCERLEFGRTRGAMEGKGEISDLLTAPISIRLLDTAPRHPITPTVALRHLDLDMDARADGTCSYVATETLVPQSSGMQLVNLGLLDTYFDTSTRAIIPHHLRVKRITQDGQPCAFSHGENELLVQLQQPSTAGVPIHLRFEVEGDILLHLSRDNRWELGSEPWFPFTVFEGMRFTAHARIRCEKPYRILASGQILDRHEDGGHYFLETRVDQPTWSFFVVAGDYYFEEMTRDGLTVRVASYAQKSSNDKKMAKLALDIIQFYEGILGPFPVKELNIVQRNDWGSGQAPSGFVFITNEAFNPLSTGINQLFSGGVNQRFAHEIAHQYWGNQVLIASMDENWISEGFAQYCSALAMRSGNRHGEYDNLLATWSGRAKDHTLEATIPTLWRARDLDDYNAAYTQWALLYGKAPLLLYHIHKEVGDQAFVTLMRSYQKSLHGRPGTTQDLINLLKIITKRDFSEFFDECLWGTGMPR